MGRVKKQMYLSLREIQALSRRLAKEVPFITWKDCTLMAKPNLIKFRTIKSCHFPQESFLRVRSG